MSEEIDFKGKNVGKLYREAVNRHPKLKPLFKIRWSIPVTIVMSAYFGICTYDYYNPFKKYGNIYQVKGYPDYANRAVIFFVKNQNKENG